MYVWIVNVWIGASPHAEEQEMFDSEDEARAFAARTEDENPDAQAVVYAPRET